MAYMNMKKSTIITALTAIMMMAVTPAFAQEEDNGEHQLSGIKKFNVREDFTENGFQWFHDAELLAANCCHTFENTGASSVSHWLSPCTRWHQ